ncbi:hypothetical protein ACLI4Y_19320 (plasmid) [Natrialbaceae archaeon A-CW3]
MTRTDIPPPEGSEENLEEDDKVKRSKIEERERQPQGGFIAAATAVPGVLVGYRKNLRNQNLTDLASQDLQVPLDKSITIDGYEVSVDTLNVQVSPSTDLHETLSCVAASDDEAAKLDAKYDLNGTVEQLVSDLPQIDDEDYEFEYHGLSDFFDRLDEGKTRPFTVELLRGFNGTDPSTVQEFTNADPIDPQEIIQKLKDAFADKTSYDIPRYIAGSITDNLLFGTVRLRPFFEHDVDYQTLLTNSNTRMFCYEFTYRAIEALHAVPAHRQTYPVLGVGVHDSQHKHYYMGVASVIRENGQLVIPMTFVDYTRTTLSSDFGGRKLMDAELNAYDSHHHLTWIDWGS